MTRPAERGAGEGWHQQASSLVYERPDHVAWRCLGEETVLVDLRANTIVALNASGGLIWAALSEPLGVDALVELTGSEAGAVACFLGDMVRRGLLTPVAGRGVSASAASGLGPGSGPPAVIWTEELHSFAAASCALLPDQSDICNQVPQG